jgi:hypothetical protein
MKRQFESGASEADALKTKTLTQHSKPLDNKRCQINSAKEIENSITVTEDISFSGPGQEDSNQEVVPKVRDAAKEFACDQETRSFE